MLSSPTIRRWDDVRWMATERVAYAPNPCPPTGVVTTWLSKPARIGLAREIASFTCGNASDAWWLCSLS
jgi:hypothetical protein